MKKIKYPEIMSKIKIHHILFSVFLALQAFVLYSVPLFGDDYYYASFIKKGLSFFITENVVHYTQSNGRAIVHILDEILLWGGTNFLWKIFNLFMIALTVYYTAAVSAKKYKNNNNFSLALIVTSLLFSLIELGMTRQTLYWATGSMNYLFTYVLFIAYFYYYRKDIEQKSENTNLWLLAFFACFSSEQAGAAALITSVAMPVYYGIKYREQIPSQYYVNLISAGAGFSFQIFAPGNVVRKTYFPEFYSKPIVERIKENAKPLYNVIFNGDGMYIFVLIAFLCLGFTFVTKAKQNLKSKNKSYIKIFALLIGAVISGFAIVYYTYALLKNRFMLTELTFLPFFAFGIIGFATVCIIRAYKNKDFDVLFFLFLAPLLQIAMLLSPQYGPRTVLISALCLFVPISGYLFEYKNSLFFLTALAAVIFALSKANLILLLFVCVAVAIIAGAVVILKNPKQYKKAAMLSVMAVIICISFSTIATSALGYLENLPAHKYNKAAVERFKNEGEDSETLILAILPNPDYKYTMPYDDKYHENWFKILNDLPSDLKIIYIDYSELK